MNMKRKIVALVMLAIMVTGMVSCMSSKTCPAYAHSTYKAQNYRR